MSNATGIEIYLQHRPTGGRSENAVSTHPVYTHRASWHAPTLCSFRSPQPSLALRCLPASHALRASAFASHATYSLLRALLAARAASFARRSSPVLLLELRSHRPANRACCSRLPLASLSPPRQLLAPLALPSARSACHLSRCSLRSPPCLLPAALAAPAAARSVSLRSPFRLLMLVTRLSLALLAAPSVEPARRRLCESELF